MEYISFDKNEIARGRSRVVGINKPKHFLALYNCNIHWIVPKTGTKIKDIPNSTQFLLWQTAEGNYGVALPLICGDLKASVCGCNDGLCVTIKGTMEGEEPDNAELLYIDYGKDPYQLTLNAVKNISERLNSFRLRTEKTIPGFLDYIGWCTWDAFYGAVDEEKVIMGLDSFKKADFPLRYMILDDGSWNAHCEYLNTASVSESKFPDGLHGLIDKAKNEYGLKMFGVWHCFTAYWCGVNPNGELAKKYNYVKSYADIRPWIEEDTSQDCYVITPEDIGAFYDELHSYLHAEGADMLKIDGQSSLDLFTDGIVGQGTAMKKYQQAMQKTAKKYFDSRVIHCMSNSIDVAYNMLTTNCWRNSYDYSPNGGMNMQKEHIYINAMNALWTSTFSYPDWDMFQTHSHGAEIHAAARAISGGPIYVCDYPDKQDFGILNKLVTSDGNILRCSQPALPTADCLFSDCRYEEKLLKIFNTNGNIGVLGIFNCNVDNKNICDSCSVSDIYGIDGENFAVYSFKNKTVSVADNNAALEITLNDGDYDVVTCSPVTRGIAPLGLLEKYNSSAAILKAEWCDNHYHAEISDGGVIGFYCETAPKKVLCNNTDANYSYDEECGLLCIKSDKNGLNTIEINI